MAQSAHKIAHREEIRSSILKAARELALQEGWEALSVRKIAEAIDYSVPVIYDHFENKEALLMEFVKQGFSILTSSLESSSKEDENKCDWVEAGEAYLRFSREYKEYYRLMFGLGVPVCDAAKKTEEYGRFQHTLEKLVSNLLPKAHSSENVRIMKYRFWTALHGIACTEIFEGTDSENGFNSVLHDFLATLPFGDA